MFYYRVMVLLHTMTYFLNSPPDDVLVGTTTQMALKGDWTTSEIQFLGIPSISIGHDGHMNLQGSFSE